MSTFPSMPLFIDAYLADTTHLTAEEHGAYLLLLMAMWRRNGKVPNDDHDLARICCVAPRRWSRVKARLLPFLAIDEAGELSQKRLRKTMNRVTKMRITGEPQKSASDRHLKTKKSNGLDHDSRAGDRGRAYPKPKPNKESSMSVLSGRARDLNGSAAMAGLPGCEGRAPAMPNGHDPPSAELLEKIAGLAAEPVPAHLFEKLKGRH